MTDVRITPTALEYRHGSARLCGVVARPTTAGGALPGVIIAHDAWGIGENVELRARMLAELGYVALGIDIYGDGVKPADVSEARVIVNKFTSDPALLRGRAAAGLAALCSLPDVDTSRVAAIGHCFGGTTVLELARSGADCAAIVSFHGLLTTTAPAAAGAIKAKLLVCTGSDDPLVPMQNVATFQEEMRNAGADCQTVIYSGAMHGFANPYSSNAPGIAHHQSADARSWKTMLALFEEALGMTHRGASE